MTSSVVAGQGHPRDRENEERSAYLLEPESEADMGQMLRRLPSSLSSPSPPGRHNLLGRGRLNSWGGGMEGGGISPQKITLTQYESNNVSLFPAEPGLPRYTAQCTVARDKDDIPGSTMLAGREGHKGLAEIAADGEKTSEDQDTVA